MAKKLVAVTNIKHDGESFEAGVALDPKLFTKEQLKSLYDSGAVAIEDVPEKLEEPEVEAPMVEETPVAEEHTNPDE